ncbi:hypothetical protein D3C72_1493240 [compost metagenome]
MRCSLPPPPCTDAVGMMAPLVVIAAPIEPPQWPLVVLLSNLSCTEVTFRLPAMSIFTSLALAVAPVSVVSPPDLMLSLSASRVELVYFVDELPDRSWDPLTSMEVPMPAPKADTEAPADTPTLKLSVEDFVSSQVLAAFMAMLPPASSEALPATSISTPLSVISFFAFNAISPALICEMFSARLLLELLVFEWFMPKLTEPPTRSLKTRFDTSPATCSAVMPASVLLPSCVALVPSSPYLFAASAMELWPSAFTPMNSSSCDCFTS